MVDESRRELCSVRSSDRRPLPVAVSAHPTLYVGLSLFLIVLIVLASVRVAARLKMELANSYWLLLTVVVW